MAIIEIEDMEFYAYHGCYKEEQMVGNQFLVSLQLEVETKMAQESDNLIDTVNYQTVYQIVSREMQHKSKLLEHVAERIITAVHDNFYEIRRIWVKVSKLNPPLGGKVERVSVILEHKF